jgi:hypothetical protein
MPLAYSQDEKIFFIAKLRLFSWDNSGPRKQPPSSSGATIIIMAELHLRSGRGFALGAFQADIDLSKLASTCWLYDLQVSFCSIWADPLSLPWGSSFSRREA